jgi:hypothetical protein
LAETGEGVCCQAAEEGLLRDDWDGCELMTDIKYSKFSEIDL